ncbi:MAG: MFS transporter [Bacteroidota bacterium]
MKKIFQSFAEIEKHILYVIYAEFFVQLINTTLFSIQLIFMQKNGYSDYEGANFISYRFLGVLLLAVPLGLYIKGRKIKHLFFMSVYASPILAIGIVFSIQNHWNTGLIISQFLWGIFFTLIQIPVLPYILRNSKSEKQTEALSLSYSTFSFAGIFGGLLIALLNKLNPTLFNEFNLILFIILLSCFGIYFIHKIKYAENIPILKTKRIDLTDFDWKIIFKGLTPTFIIAVGAGLTIPFISIFFYNVHGLNTDSFSLLNSVGAVLVAISALLVPLVKKTIGYKIAIPTTQSFAVLALILLATTQLYAQQKIAVYLAMFCFLLRQPLMNIAGPMTSEIVMNYVGKRNQEIVSALTAAIWSGSWFVSSKIFAWLRSIGIQYVYVFLITALLYGVGVIWYYILILDYVKREKAGLIESEQKIL